jgi:hypothetical protein
MRFRLAVVGLLLAVGVPAGGASAATGAGGCSKAAAKAAVLASSLPQRWKDEARHKYGPYEGIEGVLCHDFTRDGQGDMAVTFASGGTAGDVAWLVFRRVGTGWHLVLSRLQDYKLGLVVHGDDLVETQPVYRKGDANCCPSGGFDHDQWHWNGARFVIARHWHDKTYQR